MLHCSKQHMCCSLSISKRVWSENWHFQMRTESLNLEVVRPTSTPPPHHHHPHPHTHSARFGGLPPQRSQASREQKAPARESSRAGLDRSRCSKGCRLLGLHRVTHVFPLLFFNLIPCVEISGKKIAKAQKHELQRAPSPASLRLLHQKQCYLRSCVDLLGHITCPSRSCVPMFGVWANR